MTGLMFVCRKRYVLGGVALINSLQFTSAANAATANSSDWLFA